MTRQQPHPVYSQNATVHLVNGADKLSALDRAVARAGFVDHVERVYHESGKARDAFCIAIKPNIMTASVREDDSPVYTDPALVEALVDIIRYKGFREIAVVESHNVYDYSYQGRTVQAVAEMVGYRQNGYQVRNLSEEKVPYEYGGALGTHVVGRTWRDADYRISFAKNKTHWQCFYTACLKNVYGCLPEWDKMRHYHGSGIEFYEATIRIADRLPIHFGFLDAWVSGDGFSGHVRDAHPNLTRMILASDNVFALDWVAGEKMGLYPKHNFVMQEALDTWGPIRIQREGDMTPWHPWLNVRRLPVVVLAWLEEWYHVSRFFSRAMAAHQDERFAPVARARGLFSLLQAVTRFGERLMTRKAPVQSPSHRDPESHRMDPSSIGLIEAFVADLVKWLGVVVGLGSLGWFAWHLRGGLIEPHRMSVLGLATAGATAMIVGGLKGRRTPSWLATVLGVNFLAAVVWAGIEAAFGTLVLAIIPWVLSVGLAGLWSVHRRASRRRLRQRQPRVP